MASIFSKSKSKSKLSSGASSGKSKGKKFSSPLLWAIAAVSVVLLWVVFTFFQQFNSTDTYYVLSTDVPAHSQITTDELQKMTTKKGTAPPNAIGVSTVEQGSVYAQYDLLAGDTLTKSNTGGRSSLYNGVSDSWAVTSFTINSSDAVDGNIGRGDYFDILALGGKANGNDTTTSTAAVTSGNGGSYIYYNVLCLYTTAHKTSQTAKDGTTTTTGESLEYFVAMPPKDIALLQSAISSLSIKLVMSPRENGYTQPSANAYNFATFNYNGQDMKPLNASSCNDNDSNSEDCTDNTFLDVKRNKFGVPYNATSGELDSNGNLKDSKKLTKAETQWCTTIFQDPYYLGSRWDSNKEYCLSQGFSKSTAKSLAEAAKQKESSSTASSSSSSSDGTNSSSN
jgi:hypothetical protein